VIRRLAEAAYLFRLVRSLRDATIVEIGRFKGGSAFLAAVAMDGGSRLYSYDIHVKLSHVYSGEALDRELTAALERYGLADRVHVLVAVSRAAEPPGPYDLVFVDDDHRHPGVCAHYEHRRPHVRPGGHLLFHDAAELRPLVPPLGGAKRVVDEIEREDAAWFRRVGAAGSLVDVARTEASALSA
jgi:predicted O-methyltransferase YrrM